MDELYLLAVLRQAERLAEAQRAREARAGVDRSAMHLTGRAAGYRNGGLRRRMGRLLIAAGRMLAGHEEPVLAAPSPGAARIR